MRTEPAKDCPYINANLAVLDRTLRSIKQGEFNCMTWLYLSKLTMDLGLKALISSEPTQLLGPFITLQKDMISQNAIPTHA